MRFKENEYKQAMSLRRKGCSYSEILRDVPVAKSTLSLWLRSVDLSKRQKQCLTKRKLEAARRGGEVRHRYRIELTKQIKDKAIKEIPRLSRRDLWMLGIALYWAEGTKEKEYNPGCGTEFCNSDPHMIALFLKWLSEFGVVSAEDLKFTIYIHENSKHRLTVVKRYWAKVTNLRSSNFNRIYFKKHNIKTNRKNTENSYYGLLKVAVPASSVLNRRIAGWIEGTYKSLNCGMV